MRASPRWFPCVPLVMLVFVSLACSPQAPAPGPVGPGGKSDTGWVANDSYEVGAWLEATLTTKAEYGYSDLATDRGLQEQLIDDQVKYAKKTMAKHDFTLNQLAERIEGLQVSTEGQMVTLTYRARVDLVHPRSELQPFPRLEDLEQREFAVPLPLNPVGVYARAGESCAEDWDPYVLAEHKYHYYFAPHKEGCEEKLELLQAKLIIDTVYPERTAYPEYDRLLRPLDDQGTVGFRAAIMPTDDNDMTQYNDHKERIEDDLGLGDTGEEIDGGKIVRYTWNGDGATAVIDLYNPQKFYFWNTFREALKTYDVVYYDGHSNYGTYDMVGKPEYFADRYQIVMIDACRSYAYYARQVFRAKGGFERADVVGTAESAPFYVASRVMRDLIGGLMQGIAAVKRGEEHQAPSWQSIVGKMNDAAYHVYYGAAGVRDNAWQPGE